MKRFAVILLILCCLLAACAGPDPSETVAVPTVSETEIPTEVPTEVSTEMPDDAPPVQPSITVVPLPTTIDLNNLDNCTVAVSLEEGDAYVDDSGIMQMKVTVYTYDLYDMVDIAQLQGGDTIMIRGEDVVIEALDRTDSGLVRINGGLDLGGYDLWTDDSTVYFETGYSDQKSWYPLGTATVRVSADFVFTDSSDLDNDPVTLYPGDFLTENDLIIYPFTPDATTVVIQDGQIIAMERIYTP